MKEPIKTKILSGKPGRPKGVEIMGRKREEEKPVKIVDAHGSQSGTEILDKDSKTDSPSIEITVGEGDRGE